MKRTTFIVPLILLLAASASARDLEIFFVDVEGGQATLMEPKTSDRLGRGSSSARFGSLIWAI